MGAPVRIGDVLADKYKVTRILGTGGMGVVVAARHCELDKLVALKFIHEEVSSNKQITDRFLREARAAARLRNEHIVDVLDVGRLPNGVPYIVMEYLEGKDLGRLLEHHGPLEVPYAAEYVLQVCEAMAEAHAQGIVHRDLKPQNLFLTTLQDGHPLVKVLDFGISKAPFSQNPTSTSQAMGSPSYMAPEQIRSSRSVDARADIWSLGVILYQLLSNTLPFGGDAMPEVIFKVVFQPPPPLGSVRRGLPPGLMSAIDRCLEKDRERRFANVAELAHELVPFAPGRARAAISLIERVMTAGIPQPHASDPDAELAGVVPSEDAASDMLPEPLPPSPMQTTLATAASIIPPVGGDSNPPRWRWVVIAAAGVMATTVIAIIAMRGSSPSEPGVPVGALATSVPAVVATDAASLDVPPDARIDVSSETTSDAPADVTTEVTTDATIGARLTLRTSLHKVAIDAGSVPRTSPGKIATDVRPTLPTTLRTVEFDASVPLTPEPQVLEPARTDDKPLSPAR